MQAPKQTPIACLYHAQEKCWLSFSQPLAIFQTDQLEHVLPILQQVEEQVAEKKYWAVGWISYPAAPAFDAALPVKPANSFPLIWFAIFDSVTRLTELPLIEKNTFLDWQADISPQDYAQAAIQIKEAIAAGETYQVNYTFHLNAQLASLLRNENSHPWQLFLQLTQAHPPGLTAYCAYIDTPEWAICSLSPELFFSKTGHTLISRPMKGTQARGLSYIEDQQHAQGLRQSEKNRAENVMIVDMVRNDLGRVARPGSITVPHLFEIEQYPTVWQMTSTVRAETSASISDIFTALFPPASITGAPKRQAMQIINQLEKRPRELYTGSIGLLSPTALAIPDAQFNVAIRTVLINKQTQTASYGIGSGIVWDSQINEEYAECLQKAAALNQTQGSFSLLESFLWTPQEGIFLQELHFQRLQESADYFGWKIDIEKINAFLKTYVTKFSQQPHKLRLLVTHSGKFEIAAEKLQPLPSPYRIKLAVSPINEKNVFLYHKTTQRRMYQAALAQQSTCDDILLWNKQGEITESTIANLIYELDGAWYTPPIASGLLPGVFRAYLLAEQKLKERILYMHELTHCTRLGLINSVRKSWQIELMDLI